MMLNKQSAAFWERTQDRGPTLVYSKPLNAPSILVLLHTARNNSLSCPGLVQSHWASHKHTNKIKIKNKWNRKFLCKLCERLEVAHRGKE